ncbi:MAG TPA: hypothetical protein VI452_05365 [Marmoricola sp.]
MPHPREHAEQSGPTSPIRRRAHLGAGEHPSAHPLSRRVVRTELEALARRVSERFEAAPRMAADVAGPFNPVFTLLEAVLVAHDLYMLGLIDEPPTLRWGVPEAARKLARWSVHVIPERAEPAGDAGAGPRDPQRARSTRPSSQTGSADS